MNNFQKNIIAHFPNLIWLGDNDMYAFLTDEKIDWFYLHADRRMSYINYSSLSKIPSENEIDLKRVHCIIKLRKSLMNFV